jgi:O-antigen ligase
LAYLMPNHYPPWTSFHADAMAALAFVPVLIWVLCQRGAVPSLTMGALLLALVPLLQLSVGRISFAGDAIIACLYVTGFALATLCGARIALSEPRTLSSLVALAPIQAAMVLAGLLSTGIALHQWLNLGLLAIFIVELPAGYRPFANLAQPNQLATLLMLGLAAIVFLYEARIVRASLALLAALVLAFGLAMTQSRTALLALAVIWIAYFLFRKRAALRMKPVGLVLPTFVFLGCVLAWPSINDFLLLPNSGSIAERMGENLRVTLWRSMIDAVGRHPWTGYGWNQVSLAQQAIALDHPATHWWFESSHNIALDLALWAGLPIAILAAGGVLIWLKNRIAACRDPLAWSLLAGVVSVFCHALVEYPLAYAYLLIPVGLFMGALDSTVTGRRERFMALPRLFPAAIGVIAIAVFAKVVIEYIELEEEWRNVRMERSFVGGAVAQPATNIVLLTQLKARAQFARLTPTRGMLPEQLDWMRRVSERYANVSFMFPYARAAALNDQPEVASTILAKMCKVQSPKVCQQAMKEWADFGYPSSSRLGMTAPPEERLH